MSKIIALVASMGLSFVMPALAQTTPETEHSGSSLFTTFTIIPGGGAGGGSERGPLTPPPNSGDADLDKALAICREHDASHLTYGGTGIRWEPEFAASCDKVQDAYNATSLAKWNAEAEKKRSERLAKSAPERAWLDHYAETLGKKP